MSLLCAEADNLTDKNLNNLQDELLLKLKRLTERVEMLSWPLHQNFVNTYVNFTPTKSLKQLNFNISKALILADYSKFQEETKSLNDKFDEITLQDFLINCDILSKSFNMFQNLCVVVEGKSVLDKANHEFGRYNYIEAMLSVKELQNQLRSLKFEGNAMKALSTLNAQAETQLSLYTAQLGIEWEDIFTWSEETSINFLTYSLSVQQSDPSLIKKILQSLYAAERINAELSLFSHFFIDSLLHNVIQYNCEILTEEHVGALVFKILIDLNDKNKPNFQTIFTNLIAIFEFLNCTLGSNFEADKSFMDVFADTTNDMFFNKIIKDCIRSNLPSCYSSYENYKNLVLELDSFNKFLVDLKFVKTDFSPLNKYINDVECVLYDKKCDKLLYNVRNLLNESLSYGTLVVGNCIEREKDSILDLTKNLNSPLFLPKCVVSHNVRKIMSMIVEHLEESVKFSEKYKNQLVTYIKDIAVMYQSFIPKKFQPNLECCPLDIALFFNNSFYLAHSLLGLSWQNSLPNPLADLLTSALVECIQDLRVVGLEKISLYLQYLKKVIIQKIEENELPWTLNSFEVLNNAINYSITSLQKLQRAWHNILPHCMYELSLCTLIQAMCHAMLDRILTNTKPICEDLIYMLAVRFEDTISHIHTLFEEPIKFESKINNWNKFVKMPQLLKAQSLEIADLWNVDKELSESFTCEEIRLIVRLRFPDGKYRHKILKEIQ